MVPKQLYRQQLGRLCSMRSRVHPTVVVQLCGLSSSPTPTDRPWTRERNLSSASLLPVRLDSCHPTAVPLHKFAVTLARVVKNMMTATEGVVSFSINAP